MLSDIVALCIIEHTLNSGISVIYVNNSRQINVSNYHTVFKYGAHLN